MSSDRNMGCWILGHFFTVPSFFLFYSSSLWVLGTLSNSNRNAHLNFFWFSYMLPLSLTKKNLSALCSMSWLNSEGKINSSFELYRLEQLAISSHWTSLVKRSDFPSFVYPTEVYSVRSPRQTLQPWILMNNNLINNSIKKQGFRSMQILCTKSLSCVGLFATPWTVARQAPLSMGFSRQEYWSGLPCPPPGDHLHPGIKPRSPTLQADSSPSEPPGNDTNDRHWLVLKADVYLIETQLFIST